MNLVAHASALDLAVVATALAVIGAMARWQSRMEHDDAAKPFQQEWEESGWRSLHRGEFQLCRIVPVRDWPKSEFTFQDERRAELGRFRWRSRSAATIEYAGGPGAEVVQPRPTTKGQVRSPSRDSIVFRDEDRLIAEAHRQAGLSRTCFRLLWRQEEFEIEKRKWSIQGTNFVRRDQELIGVFRRTGGLSRKTLFALRSDLPEELKVCLCSIAVLE